jgi:hypothetical protein
MRLRYSVFLAVFASTIGTATSRAQELLTLSNYCVFDGSPVDNEVYGFASDQEANAALQRVMQYTGLNPNFVLRAANVPNAVANIQGSQRYILYNQQFMMQVRTATNTEWSAISILAHEIGHHLQGHTLIPGGSRPNLELEADRYSGYVLYRMGASLPQAQAAMNFVANDQGSSTHPGKQARLAAITNGWIEARDLQSPPTTQGSQQPNPNPVPQPAQQPSPQPTPGQTTPTYVARAVFPGDPVAYFITPSDDIVAIHPQTGQPVVIGRRMPPTVPGFAWMYSTPYGSYGVTPDGRIMNRDPIGNVFQVGYITNP